MGQNSKIILSKSVNASELFLATVQHHEGRWPTSLWISNNQIVCCDDMRKASKQPLASANWNVPAVKHCSMKSSSKCDRRGREETRRSSSSICRNALMCKGAWKESSRSNWHLVEYYDCREKTETICRFTDEKHITINCLQLTSHRHHYLSVSLTHTLWVISSWWASNVVSQVYTPPHTHTTPAASHTSTPIFKSIK